MNGSKPAAKSLLVMACGCVCERFPDTRLFLLFFLPRRSPTPLRSAVFRSGCDEQMLTGSCSPEVPTCPRGIRIITANAL